MRTIIEYGLLAPALLLNSQHHLVIIGPGGLSEATHSRLTAFAGFRMDCYSRDVTWARLSPMAGIQHAFNLTGSSDGNASNWLALSAGIEAPVDFEAVAHSIPPRSFVGVKYYTPFTR